MWHRQHTRFGPVIHCRPIIQRQVFLGEEPTETVKGWGSSSGGATAGSRACPARCRCSRPTGALSRLAPMYEGMRDGTAYRDAFLLSFALVAILGSLVWAAVKARTRGGRAVSLLAALLVVLGVLVAVPAIGWLAAGLRAAAEALRP